MHVSHNLTVKDSYRKQCVISDLPAPRAGAGARMAKRDSPSWVNRSLRGLASLFSKKPKTKSGNIAVAREGSVVSVALSTSKPGATTTIPKADANVLAVCIYIYVCVCVCVCVCVLGRF